MGRSKGTELPRILIKKSSSRTSAILASRHGASTNTEGEKVSSPITCYPIIAVDKSSFF